MTNTSISNELLASYKQARYHVYGPPSFILRIGHYSPELHKMYKTSSKKIATFITAFNPASIELSNQENKKRNQQLEKKLKGFIFVTFMAKGNAMKVKNQAKRVFWFLRLIKQKRFD